MYSKFVDLCADIQRRSLEYEERKYLVEMGHVTETQSNLGLLAVKSDNVLAVMQEEYPAKYKVSFVVCVYMFMGYICTIYHKTFMFGNIFEFAYCKFTCEC